MRSTILGLLLALITSVGAAPKFIPADDSYPLLRRDLVPLDVDSIQELASHLAILGDGPAPEEAAKLRDKAKALTLSQRLSPTEPRARAAILALTTLESRPAPSKEESDTARKTTLQAAQWLIELPAETEGHRLGQLLLDVLAPIMPGNSLIQSRDVTGEAARWRGILANLSDFEGKPKITPATPVSPLPTTPSAPPIPPAVAQTYKTLALLTSVPMLCKGIPQTSPIEPALVKTTLVITPRKNDSPDLLRFQPKPDFDLEPLHLALRNFFEATGHPLPDSHTLAINTDSRQYVDSNRENIAAPIAMMLDAAVTGRPLRRNTYLFARLAADGTLNRPHKAWELLLHLIQTKAPRNARLIIGTGMEEELNALLVIQKAGFFVDYEVIAAPTFEAARELFYEDGKPDEALTNAIAGYQEVREKAILATNLGTFLSLTAVETRLIKARESSPLHLSARLLATQSIRRPTSFTTFMLAQELDRRLQPLTTFLSPQNHSSSRELRDLYKTSRESVQPLEKLADREGLLLLKEALLIIQELNSIARTADDTFTTRAAMEAFHEKASAFRTKIQALYETK